MILKPTARLEFADSIRLRYILAAGQSHFASATGKQEMDRKYPTC